MAGSVASFKKQKKMDSEINLASRRFEVLKNKIWTFLAQGLVNVFNEALPFFFLFSSRKHRRRVTMLTIFLLVIFFRIVSNDYFFRLKRRNVAKQFTHNNARK